MRIMGLIHIRRLYEERGMLFVDAEEILEKVHRPIGMRVVAGRIRVEASAETVPRIMGIYATRFGVMGVDDF